MNVKLKVLGAAAVFFLGGESLMAQKRDTATKTKDIAEVVVLGYSKQSTKAKSTVAGTTITAESLENRPNVSFLNSVQGSSPGITINTQSGSPGSGQINVKVRGVGSLNASVDPLYVIDGLISSGTEFRNLNSNDIETLTVLRDAQATAIYGNYGANGVVVITTKGARFNSGLRVGYDVTTSFSTFPKHDYDLASADELLLIQERLGYSIGRNIVAAQGGVKANTDWNKEYFRVGMSQQHNVGIRYGGENFTAFTSLGYLETEGIIKSTDFKRFTFRTNIAGRSSNKRFSYNTQIALGYSKRNELDVETNSDLSNNSIQNPLLSSIMGAPYLESYSSRFNNGKEMFDVIGSNFTGRNQWITSDVINGGVMNRRTQMSVLVNGSATYKITDDFSVTNKSGINYKDNLRNFARTPYGYLSTVVAASSQAEYGGFEQFTNVYDTTFNSVTSLNYDKTLGDHSFNVGAYIDYLRGFYSSTGVRNNGLNPLEWVFGAGTGYVPFNVNTPALYRPTNFVSPRIKAGTLAYIGTLEYDYAGKYGVSGTIRRDGSYRFSEGNKWTTFWSVAGRWNIDRESFMEGSVFNMLKLRLSYGTNGNQNLFPGTLGMSALYRGANLVRDVYESGAGYNGVPGFYTSLQNSELSWEKISQANVGLDFGLFRNRLEGNIDVYQKETKGMFYLVPISGINASYSIRGNNGTMRNRGVEALVRYNAIKGQTFNLSVSANGTYNQNRITDLPSEDLTSDLVHSVGGPAYQWYLYRYVGVNSTNGNLLYLDANGNQTESPTAEDRIFTGKSVIPKFTGGFGFEADYKGFFLTSQFSYQLGGWSRDIMEDWVNRPTYANGSNVSRALLDAWTPTNTGSNIPSLSASNTGLAYSSDKFLRKTDFLRLKNVTFGYSIPKGLLAQSFLRTARVFVMAENLLTLTSWNGYDPEVAITGSTLGVYPNAKTYSVGLSVEF